MSFVVVASVFFLLIRYSVACTATRPTPMPEVAACKTCAIGDIDLTVVAENRDKAFEPFGQGTAADGCSTLTFLCINNLPNPDDAFILWNGNAEAGVSQEPGQKRIQRTVNCNNMRQWILNDDGVVRAITKAQCVATNAGP